MVSLANGFALRGYRVDLVLASRSGPYVSEVAQHVNVIDLRARRTATCLPRFVKYLRQARPLVLLSTLEYANLLAIWARALSRVSTRVYLREANTTSALIQCMGPLTGRALPMLMRWFYPRANGVVAVSVGVADDLAHYLHLPASRVHTIYSPIITTQLRTLASEPLDHPWFQPGAPPVVLSTGRLAPHKDFPTLLRAFALARRDMSIRLMILGEGNAREDLEQLAESLGIREHVEFPGFVANPFAFMTHAGLFVLSSRVEGLPGALIQAIACGCPAVSTDCPSGPREVLHQGLYGELIPVGDHEALARAIERALRSPRIRVPADHLEAYSEERAINNYLGYMGLPLMASSTPPTGAHTLVRDDPKWTT